MHQIDEEIVPQPVLPTFSMRWLFVAMVLIAIGISVIMQNTIDRTLIVVLCLMGGIACVFFFLSAASFLLCNQFETLRELRALSNEPPQSPFAGDRLPPQIVPRNE